ncbi:ferredoxin [Candidatus Micrarchaeota archaeon]|nr:ferredoxin [Candidatus Micrarchaeota archaeon]
MVVKVDAEKCIGCGLCVSICPDVFELGDDGKACIKNPRNCSKCDCKGAAEGCPVQAISL